VAYDKGRLAETMLRNEKQYKKHDYWET
jgi:hypothetical protein